MSTDLELRKPTLHLLLDTLSPERPEESSDLGCTTPKGTENRIPAVLTCPPAPRKRRRPATMERCKRRLELFKTVAGEEIELFFRSSFENVAKKRCRVCI